jgi:cell division septation protein DedD
LAKNEEGEFELILGNRQLISVFLIVVILLGVFFSMGYIVGRNSAPAGSNDTARNPKPDVASASPDTSNPAPVSPPAEITPAPIPKSTHPAQSETKPVPAAVAVTKPSKPSPAAPARVAPAASSDSGEPGPGDYWQVVATTRPDAEIITEALAKKGFHAILAPAPREGVFRVLVGPLKDSGTQAQTRTQLEAAGFKNPIVRKY